MLFDADDQFKQRNFVSLDVRFLTIFDTGKYQDRASNLVPVNILYSLTPNHSDWSSKWDFFVDGLWK